MTRSLEKRVGVALLLAVSGGLALGARSAVAGEPDLRTRVVVDCQRQLAADLYAQLRNREGSLCISPYSVYAALMMTLVGARGETGQQLSRVLHGPMRPVDLHAMSTALEASLKELNSEASWRLDVANALWAQAGESVTPEFPSFFGKHYGSAFHEVDFGKGPEPARQIINTWVAQQTRQKIKELLQPNELSTDTRLVLTNAVYLKADWAEKFDAEWTKDAPFHVAPGKDVSVPLMNLNGVFSLYSTDTMDVLELPYAGGRLVMVVVLPKKTDGLAALEKTFQFTHLRLDRGKPQPVSVRLPRFTADYRVDLAATLAALGMPDAFTLPPADFSGLNSKRDLVIGQVIHQTHIGVNEAGTEAAAATAVEMKIGSPPQTPTPFVADHPFLFFIQDRQTWAVLFLGRLANPAE